MTIWRVLVIRDGKDLGIVEGGDRDQVQRKVDAVAGQRVAIEGAWNTQ